MNTLFIFLLTFVAIDCNAFEDIGDKLSQSTPPDDPDPGFSTPTPRTTNLSDKCAEKCSEEISLLKKNMSQLLTAFGSLREEFEHMKQHLIFHEKALKHIAVWGHKPVPPNSNEKNFDDIDHTNISALSEQSNETDRDMRAQADRHRNHHHVQHRHQHDHNRHHHHHSHHNHHNHHDSGNRGCGRCPPQSEQPPKGGEDEEIEDKITSNKTTSVDNQIKDSSEESSEEVVVKPVVTTVGPESDPQMNSDNGSIPLNDSHKPLSPEKSLKGVRFTKPLIDEQLYFQSMESEFKDWFSNMLNDIHRQPSDRRSNRLNKEFKRSDQSAIDEMDNALNSEDLVFATCNMKPNRHIALLNQQDIEGTINMWQLSNNRGPLHMHIKLKGFKVNNHEHNGKGRRRRESNLMPVEQEPDDGRQPIGASHSHGFHVHEFGNLSRDCQSVGNHYNPLSLAHGGPFDVVRHVGDLGNIRCSKNGEIDTEFSYSQVSLTGPHSIVNRSLVIHSNADDFGRKPNSPSSLQTGSSGVRIACCVIEEVKQLPKEVDSESSVGSVSGPVVSAKRKRETSEPMFVNRNRFKESSLSEIIRKSEKFENRRNREIGFQ